MKTPHVLIVEDEHALALALAATVRRAGASSDLAPTATRAGKMLESKAHDLMILDIGLPDRNGLDFLKSLSPAVRPPTLVITAHGEIDNTIAARKLGVAEFLTKPLDFDAFQQVLARLLRPPRPARDREESTDAAAFIGAAAAMRPVFQQIAHCCASDDPVLVRGETGSGKSHAARVIRENGPGGDGPAVTLVAGPATTAADIDRALREAERGVLLIEEPALLGGEAQAELVRWIETGRERGLPRLIATTREDLRARVAADGFRSDLFYRLQILEVRLPPLRERVDDLPALVSYFLGRLEPGRAVTMGDAALARLAAHDWPGNLRELSNALSFALTVSAGAPVIEEVHLPAHLTSSRGGTAPHPLVGALDAWLEERFKAGTPPNYRELSEALEARLISRLLRRYDGKLARLASALGANRTTLRRKLRGAERGNPPP
jgi:DNA-binding NtrC family response regulator